MSYSVQIAKNLFPFECFECSAYFWLRPSSAQRYTSRGKNLLCRNCQELHFSEVSPPPFCNRLTKDEVEEHRWEVHAQELKDEKAANLKQPTDSLSPISSPSPPMAKRQKHVSSREEQTRQNLKNSLLASGVTPWSFGQAAGFGANARKTIQKFIDGTGQRATMTSVLSKIEAEMKQRGWIQDAEASATPAAAQEARTPGGVFWEEAGALDRDDMFRVIHAIMGTDWPHADRYRILGTLFPNCR